MAVAAAAALLDELMGRSRNDCGSVRKKLIRWDDPEYCKYYMVQFCPHDLFVNTKADLGPCPKVHCDEAKGQFDKAEGYTKVQYEDDFLRFAQGMLNDVERKIIKGEQRLALMGKSEPPPKLTNSETQKNEEQITLLTLKINDLVNEAEQMGIQGNVEQAQGLMKLCDQLKEERESLQKQNESSQWSTTVELAVAQEKQMEVCKVCGAFLIVGDAQSRIDDHLMGKQHTGYGRLKVAVDEILKKREDEKIEKEKRREEERLKRVAEREAREKEANNKSRSPQRYNRLQDSKPYDRNNRDNFRGRDRVRDYSRGRFGDRDNGGGRDRNSYGGYKDKHYRSERVAEKDYVRGRSHHDDNGRDRERDRDKRSRSHRADSHSNRSRSREKDRTRKSHSRDKSKYDHRDEKHRKERSKKETNGDIDESEKK